VTVKDDEENFVNDIIEIVNITPLLLSITTTPSGNEASGVAELIATGGIPPYLYSINYGEPSTQNIFSDLPPGYYRADVIDIRGCQATSEFEIPLINIDNTLLLNVDKLTSNLDAATYQWINSETQTAMEGEVSKTFQAKQTGKYRVAITSTSAASGGEKDKLEGPIGISSATYEITNILSVNNNMLKTNKIYPNPALDYLRVPESCMNKNYIICSFSGKKFLSGRITSQEISVEELSSGIYFIQFEDFYGSLFMKI